MMILSRWTVFGQKLDARFSSTLFIVRNRNQVLLPLGDYLFVTGGDWLNALGMVEIHLRWYVNSVFRGT